jgi:hypothetical protein
MAGLAHTILGHDPTRGAFLDNLHVTHQLKRPRIGTRLLALTRAGGPRSHPVLGPVPVLWVLEQNSDARAFYAARDAVCVDRFPVPPPGGDPGRLTGQPVTLTYAWPDPARLLMSRP